MGKSQREELAQYADPGFEIPEKWTRDSLTVVEARRLARFGLQACYAAEVPRRIGGDASSAELAADKKLSKRIAYVYLTLWQRLILSQRAPLPLEECPEHLIPPTNWKHYYLVASGVDDVRQVGSTVEWVSWWNDVRPRLEARRMMMASFSTTREEWSWGYQIIGSLTNEIDWIQNKFDIHQAKIDRATRISQIAPPQQKRRASA